MKRISIMLLLIGLFAIPVPVSASASAGAAPKPKVVLEDPTEDANAVNDQGTSDGTFGDQNQAGADASEFADIVSVGFSNDKKNLYVFIETQSTAQPSAGEGFRVRANPAAGGVYCLNFEIYFNGAQNTLTTPEAIFRDACGASDPVAVKSEISIHGGYMITVPRKGMDALGKGKELAAPQAQTFLYSGSNYPAGVSGPYFDTTKAGTDYKLR
ncbi:MAG: hypothetical protein ACRDLB_09030 [Actinomycetota bacterium]